MKTIIASSLFLAITSLSCSTHSNEPQESKPDLIIENLTITPSYPVTPGIIDCSLQIRNIGKGDFWGLLYVESASEKYYQRWHEYGNASLVYADWSGDSIKPGLIRSNEVILAPFGVFVPEDTNVVRLRIDTDNGYSKPGTIPLPVYEESNYDNNEYLFTLP